MQIEVKIHILGAKRRTYQEKVYCDVFAVENLQGGADQVGQSAETYRADGVVVDELRHKQLPGLFHCTAEMLKFGKSTVLVLKHVGDPVVSAVAKPAARAA